MSKNNILFYNQKEYYYIGVQKRIKPFISPQTKGRIMKDVFLAKIFVPEGYNISKDIIKEHFGDFLKCHTILGKHADILDYPEERIWPPQDWKYDPINQEFI